MSVTIDVAGLSPSQYRFGPSQLAELASALHALVEPDHHPAQSDWIQSMRGLIDPSLLAGIRAADYLWRTSRADMLLPANPSPTLADELDVLDALDDETWVRSALITTSCGHLPAHAEVGSPLTDMRARDIVRDRAAARGDHQVKFVDAVIADPGWARTHVRGLLESAADTFFAAIWRQLVGILTTEAQRRNDLLQRHGLAATVKSLSPSVVLDQGNQTIVIDKLQDRYTSARRDGITFVPSFFGNPHVLIVHTPGWRPVLQYPVHLAAAPEDITALETVQRRMHALDHPMRLRMARSLARGPHTTGELASIWNISAPEVSRYLLQLKRAGLLTATRHGRYVHYTLDHAATARLGADIIAALLR
jgi:DNA-binding transcriptional ArsR family regulator